jgi:hypothetical protein
MVYSMRTIAILLAAVCAAWSLPAGAAKKPKAPPADAKPAPTPKNDPKKVVSFTDDLDKVHEICTLTKPQRTRLEALIVDRDKALTRWDERNDPKIEAANDKLADLILSIDAEARAKVHAHLEALYASRRRVADGYEKILFSILTSLQKKAWNVTALQTWAFKKFAPCDLTDEQFLKVQLACRKEVELLLMPVAPRTHPNVYESLFTAIHDGILTVDQRHAYEAAHKAAKPPGKGKKGKR